MNELLIKYESLDSVLQQQVLSFVNYLLSVNKTAKPINISDYKKKLLNIFTWEEEDIEVFEQNKKYFKQWNTQPQTTN